MVSQNLARSLDCDNGHIVFIYLYFFLYLLGVMMIPGFLLPGKGNTFKRILLYSTAIEAQVFSY
jgi:hypothetical protein